MEWLASLDSIKSITQTPSVVQSNFKKKAKCIQSVCVSSVSGSKHYFSACIYLRVRVIVYRFSKMRPTAHWTVYSVPTALMLFHTVHPFDVCSVSVSVMVLDRLWCCLWILWLSSVKHLPNIVMYACRSLICSEVSCTEMPYWMSWVHYRSSIFVKLLSCDMVNCCLCRLFSSLWRTYREPRAVVFFLLPWTAPKTWFDGTVCQTRITFRVKMSWGKRRYQNISILTHILLFFLWDNNQLWCFQ